MKTNLRTIRNGDKVYDALMFVCPGCVAGGADDYQGIHMLPVNAEGIDRPYWTWNGSRDKPTLSPSILSHEVKGVNGSVYIPRCHSYLRDGVFEFLSDSTHPLAGQKVEIPDLPEWAERLN